jgi:hypothetical protein
MKEITYPGLRKFNFTMFIFHFVQAVFMLVLSLTWSKIIEFTPTIYSYFLKFNSATFALETDPEPLFNLPFGILVSSFLFISAATHFIISVPKKTNDIYNRDLKRHMNQFRWYEYALSSSIMIVLIAVLFGVYDIGALIVIFLLNASMNFFGLLMERTNQDKEKVDWLPFIFGAIAGIGAWIVIALYGFGNADPSQVPWFVYAIVATYFVFFNLFPINMVLQYKKVGNWKNYLYGEKVYVYLSLFAKTALAWLVLFGVMQPTL